MSIETARAIFEGYPNSIGIRTDGMTIEDMQDELNRELVERYMDFVSEIRSSATDHDCKGEKCEVCLANHGEMLFEVERGN